MISIIFVIPSKFPLGEIVITSNAAARLKRAAVRKALTRHASGDWGDVCPDDAKSNEEALKHSGRLLSVYGTGTEKFWIITECDRSVTTVLMPEDY